MPGRVDFLRFAVNTDHGIIVAECQVTDAVIDFDYTVADGHGDRVGGMIFYEMPVEVAAGVLEDAAAMLRAEAVKIEGGAR